jgi:hypothetical protein
MSGPERVSGSGGWFTGEWLQAGLNLISSPFGGASKPTEEDEAALANPLFEGEVQDTSQQQPVQGGYVQEKPSGGEAPNDEVESYPVDESYPGDNVSFNDNPLTKSSSMGEAAQREQADIESYPLNNKA